MKISSQFISSPKMIWASAKNTFLPLFICILGLSCTKPDATQTEEPSANSSELRLTPEQEKSFGITLGNSQIRTVYDAIVLNGVVEVPPQQTASVSFPLTGTVRSIHVLAGSQVSKGSTLATIESLELIQLQEDYWKTVGQLIFAEQERQRQTTLNQEDVGTKRKLQQAESEVRVLEASKQGLEAKLQLIGLDPNSLKTNQIVRSIALRSPINGTVKLTKVSIGASVGAGEALFEIANQVNARLVLKVFEKDFPQIKIGQKIVFQGGSGTITSISNYFDPTSRTVDVYATLQGVRVISGQYLNAKLESSPRQAETVPDMALVRTGETAHVFIKTPQGIYQPIEVKAGVSQEEFVEVIFSSKPNAPIVLSGAQTLQAELTKDAGEEE